MAYPKLKPCPFCKAVDSVSVYSYDSGTRRAECDSRGCSYIAPYSGNIRQAIKLHNAEYERRMAESAASAKS